MKIKENLKGFWKASEAGTQGIPKKSKRKRKFKVKKGRGHDSFYASLPWRTLRYQALKQLGKKCACCESTTGPFHVDHIKPRSRFPALELALSNLQILCEDCNLGKGGWDDTDWRQPELTQEQSAHMRDILQ